MIVIAALKNVAAAATNAVQSAAAGHGVNLVHNQTPNSGMIIHYFN